MNSKIQIKSLLLGILLGAGVISWMGAAPGNGRTDWEYRVVTGRAWEDELSKIINIGVGDGWEFVSASGPNNENWGIAVLRRQRR